MEVVLNMDDLSITWEMDHGVPGDDLDPDNPLARSLHRLLTTGKPFSRLSLAFFGNVPKDPPRWFGSFVVSDGDRVVFFPGLADSDRRIRIVGTAATGRQIQLDHITLEKNLDSWHMTSRGSADHLSGGTTEPLGNGALFWFGWSVADEATLRLVRRNTATEAAVPPTDAERRTQVLEEARDGAVFPHISVSDVASVGQERFLHFSVFVGRTGFTPHQGTTLGIPWGAPFLASPLPSVISNLVLRWHKFAVSADVEVQVTAMRLPGQLGVPFALTAR
jgi:hypothetical protein